MSDDECDDPNYNPEEEIIGDKWKLVDLPEVPVVTGEENEEVLTKFRSKLYRFRKGEWKERGIGELKFLKSKDSGAIRVLMRAEKTLKIILNHLLQKKEPFCILSELKTAARSWVWVCNDFSDEKAQVEKVCAKFLNEEDYKNFSQIFDQFCEENEKHLASKGKKEQEQAGIKTVAGKEEKEEKEEKKGKQEKEEKKDKQSKE